MNGLRVLVIPKGYKRKLSQVVHSYSFDAVILEEYLRTGDEEYEIEQHMKSTGGEKDTIHGYRK